VARNTIDDFVQTVLEKKAALVSAIVDGTALAPGLSGTCSTSCNARCGSCRPG
jgi:hypothetical protein